MDKKTIIRLVALVLALLNVIFGFLGWTPIPMDGTAEALYEIGSIVATVVVSAWNVWKNNNFTAAAKIAQKIINYIKSGKLSLEKVQRWLEEAVENTE